MSELPTSPLFWATHYDLCLGEPVSDYILEGSGESLDMKYRWREIDPNPTFSFSMPENLVFEVVYETNEVLYTIRTHHFDDKIILGYHSAHWALPALRWDELLAIRGCVYDNTGDPVKADMVLLLAFPGTWLNVKRQQHTQQILTQCWGRVNGLDTHNLSKIVNECLNQPVARWRLDSKLGWITDERHSPRNPDCLMFESDPDYFKIVDTFVHAIIKGFKRV